MAKNVNDATNEQDNALLSDDMLENVSGGGLGPGEKYIDGDGVHWTIYDSGDLYPCPECGSDNVTNWDPGPCKKMKVECHDCGYFGDRGLGWKGYT